MRIGFFVLYFMFFCFRLPCVSCVQCLSYTNLLNTSSKTKASDCNKTKNCILLENKD